MKTVDTSWKTFLLRALVLGAVIFVAVRTAVARPGVPGGAARSFVTIAGTITGTGASGALMAEFRFHRPGAMPRCAPQVMITNREPATGEFSVEVPLDQSGRVCPDDLFDGSDVQVDVVVNGEAVATNAAINPVPYAIHADLASQYGTPDCPVGYQRFVDGATVSSSWTVCRRYASNSTAVLDELVKVGSGSAAFWVDRYEATVWSTSSGPSGSTQMFRSDGDFPETMFPRNGQWRVAGFAMPPPPMPSPPAYALSVAGHLPAQWITWFQAQEACRASGKRLPSGEEWLAAAQGTDDPGDHLGTDGRCRTGIAASGPGVGEPRNTGAGNGCRSAWGAQDMIGNVGEWTAEWVIDGNGMLSTVIEPMPDTLLGAYRDDAVIGIHRSSSFRYYHGALASPGSVLVPGMPAAILRGGGVADRTNGGSVSAGVFALAAHSSPTVWGRIMGFRCVVPR